MKKNPEIVEISRLFVWYSVVSIAVRFFGMVLLA
jgi:hypothetical protein